MRVWAALMLVCLAGAAGRAAAELAPPTCGAAGVAGGWQPIPAEEAQKVAFEFVDAFLVE